MNSRENIFHILSRKLLDQGNSVRFKARGDSMRPLLNDGDIITIAPIDNKRLKTGDIVFYVYKGRPLVHRITGFFRSDGRVTAIIQGDACGGASDHVLLNNIWGRVIKRERQGKVRRLDSESFRLLGLLVCLLRAPLICGKRCFSAFQKKSYG